MNKFATVCAFLLLFAVVVAVNPAAAQGTTATKPAAPTAQAPAAAQQGSPFKDEKAQYSYALGQNLGNNFRANGIDVDLEMLNKGMDDAISGGNTLLTDDEVRAVLTKLQSDLRAKLAEKRKLEGEAAKKEGDEFLAANKAKPGVMVLPSGLQYKILTGGLGPKPTPADTVVCNYRGMFINGKEFDSSYKRGQPAEFPVGGVIKGWTEALQLMPLGSKWELYIPAELAYGERGAGNDIPPNSALIFQVELLNIKPKTAPAPAAQPVPEQ